MQNSKAINKLLILTLMPKLSYPTIYFDEPALSHTIIPYVFFCPIVLAAPFLPWRWKLNLHPLEADLWKLLWIDCFTVPIEKRETYCEISNTRHTKSQNLNVSRLVLQLSLPNPLKPGVKSRMKL